MAVLNECEGAQRRERVRFGKRMEMMEWDGTNVEISVEPKYGQGCTPQGSAESLEAFPGLHPAGRQSFINLKDSPIAYTHRVAHDQARICEGFVPFIHRLSKSKCRVLFARH